MRRWCEDYSRRIGPRPTAKEKPRRSGANFYDFSCGKTMRMFSISITAVKTAITMAREFVDLAIRRLASTMGPLPAIPSLAFSTSSSNERFVNVLAMLLLQDAPAYLPGSVAGAAFHPSRVSWPAPAERGDSYGPAASSVEKRRAPIPLRLGGGITIRIALSDSSQDNLDYPPNVGASVRWHIFQR